METESRIQHPTSFNRILSGLGNYFVNGVLILLSILFILELILSLQWRISHDTALNHYLAFLIDEHGRTLYGNLFDNQMPGTFIFHLTIGKLFGYGDLAFRIVDIVWLLAFLFVTWKILIPLGNKVAWAGSVLFGLNYFEYGPTMSLQRDYIGLLFIGLALLTVIYFKKANPNLRSFLIGLFFGIPATIKPHLMIGLPLVLFYFWWETGNSQTIKLPNKKDIKRALKIILFAAMGAVVPVLICVIWLLKMGTLSSFINMATTYLPLHVGQTGEHEFLVGKERLIYLLKSLRYLGGLYHWLIPACLGVYIALFNSEFKVQKKSLVYLLAGMTILYCIYPVFSGQFWDYHWMPFNYFVVVVASLTLIPIVQKRRSLLLRFYPFFILLLAIWIGLTPPVGFTRQLRGLPLEPPHNGRVDEIADFLKKNLRPGDKVQPLDWTGGAIHGMLIARADLASSFYVDYHFYHHLSNPYIKELKSRFMSELNREKPRFIIDVLTDRPWLSGNDTSREFKEVRDFIKEHYRIDFEGDGYNIYEWSDTPDSTEQN